MQPIDWQDPAPNYSIGISGIVTTVETFNVNNGLIVDQNGNSLGSFQINNVTGFTFVGSTPVSFQNASFPITVSGTINVTGTALNMSVSTQHALGSKSNSGVPVCYQVSVFCNDDGADNDWNDLVLNFQLFDSSTD